MTAALGSALVATALLAVKKLPSTLSMDTGPSAGKPGRDKFRKLTTRSRTLFTARASPTQHPPDQSQGQESIKSERQGYPSPPRLPEKSEAPQAGRQGQGEVVPALAKAAQNYPPVPACPAPVERIFSIAGKVCCPDRLAEGQEFWCVQNVCEMP